MNSSITDELYKVSAYYSSTGDKWRGKAFEKAATSIKSLPFKVTSVDQLKNIPGVGEGVTKRISEILNTGVVSEVKNVLPYQELTKIYGIGDVKARELIQMGINSIADLEQAYLSKKLNLTPSTLFGLQYVKHFDERIPRDEVTLYGSWMIKVLKTINPKIKAEIVGSYRRGAISSGDIDILFTLDDSKSVPELNKIVTYLRDIGFIRHIFSLGPVKFQGAYTSRYTPATPDSGIMRKFDIRYVPISSWPTALLHATGSDKSNIRLRDIAQSKGLKLSEHGLVVLTTGINVPITDENDVFTYLGEPYLEPSKR